jgi:negative regulator of sigma E activity
MENKVQVNQSIEDDSSGVSSGDASRQESAGLAPRPELLESLSAMMDDEAESLEVRRIVKSVAESPLLQNHWRRYHAVRASLQHEIHTTPNIDLLAAIQARLNDEAKPGSTAGIFRSRWNARVLRVAGQGLIAATVAAAVLVGYPVLNVAQNGNSAATVTQSLAVLQATAQPAPDALPHLNGDYSASPLTRTVSLDEAARSRLETAVRNFSGTTAVLNSSNSAMFVNQLEPFATNSPAVPATASPAVSPAQQH